MSRIPFLGRAVAAAALSLCFSIPASSDLIETVAGNGAGGFSGDGGQATQASLYYPMDIATDGAGNFYIADTVNSRVRKLDPNGILTTVMGSGVYEFSGDGGPATQAGGEVYGVGADRLGNVYIATYNNQRIRKVDANGIITTVAGSGAYGFSGDGGPATQASFACPTGVAVDGAGNLYIADYINRRVRKVDTNGIITTVAGNGTWSLPGDGGPATEASLWGPHGVAVDAAGNLYIADLADHRIRKVDTNGIITTVAGREYAGFSGDGGPATEAALANPFDVAVDGAGNVFIADSPVNRIRRVDANGIITTVAGNGAVGSYGDGGPATQAALDYATGVTAGGPGDFYIADYHNHRIRRVTRYPAVMSTAPADHATDVPLGQVITVSFDENIQLAPPETGILLYDEKRFAPVDRTLGVTANVLTITPAGLDKNTTYSVTLPAFGIRDLEGNEMRADKVFYFTTLKK